MYHIAMIMIITSIQASEWGEKQERSKAALTFGNCELSIGLPHCRFFL